MSPIPMKPSILFPVIALAVLLSSCGQSYNTAYPPPKNETTYKEILPEEIGGEAVSGEQLPLDPASYRGLKATYGTGASITVLQCKDQDAMDRYLKDTVVPSLEGYGSRSSGKFNGVWSVRGKGANGRIQGWQNQSWFFLIEASNDKLFDEAVEKFPYISRK